MMEPDKFPILVPKKMHNMKCYAYIAAFAVFQTLITLAFGLFPMPTETPTVRARSVAIQDYCASDEPFFNITLVAEVAVRNKNFGHFRFDPSRANVTYGGVIVGNGDITKARASARKTRIMNVTIEVRSAGVLLDGARLSNELKLK
ncbi:late embryogenesis abundant protein At1g64065-like [Prunus avium]|uniref:Late embryogenesis abundant protein At1g64065-like n=1 Tax=Prunus avium TaxID=42229 RepID=A0A6P5T1U1_PRUAV|nr:late embryogenesis abundant protein At1g64065-like [Prunus avium]